MATFNPVIADVQHHQKPAQAGGATVVQQDDGGNIIVTNPPQPVAARDPRHLQENLMIAPTGGLTRPELPSKLGMQFVQPPIPVVCEIIDYNVSLSPCRVGAAFECYSCGTFMCQAHRKLWQSKYVCNQCQAGVKKKTGAGCGGCSVM